MLRDEFRALNAYVQNKVRYKINSLSFHLRKLGKEEQIKSEVHRKQEVIKIRGEINEIENRKSI